MLVPHHLTRIQLDVFQQCRQVTSQEARVLSSIQSPVHEIRTNDVVSNDATPYIDTPLTLVFYLTKPMRIFRCPVVHVVQIDVSMVCKRCFISE